MYVYMFICICYVMCLTVVRIHCVCVVSPSVVRMTDGRTVLADQRSFGDIDLIFAIVQGNMVQIA